VDDNQQVEVYIVDPNVRDLGHCANRWQSEAFEEGEYLAVEFKEMQLLFGGLLAESNQEAIVDAH
jgi:hypothetical protein